jgi:hypothetical protein
MLILRNGFPPSTRCVWCGLSVNEVLAALDGDFSRAYAESVRPCEAVNDTDTLQRPLKASRSSEKCKFQQPASACREI